MYTHHTCATTHNTHTHSILNCSWGFQQKKRSCDPPPHFFSWRAACPSSVEEGPFSWMQPTASGGSRHAEGGREYGAQGLQDNLAASGPQIVPHSLLHQAAQELPFLKSLLFIPLPLLFLEKGSLCLGGKTATTIIQSKQSPQTPPISAHHKPGG